MASDEGIWRRRRWSLRARLALAAGAALAALGVAEVALRAIAHWTRRERGVTLDEHLGWHMLPNVEKTGAGWGSHPPARTNSHGWRDAEHAYERPSGTELRVLALGDSYTFGPNVPYGERFTEVLEDLIPKSEVINLAASAFGPDQELIAYRVEGRRYRPDVVLWTVFLRNDLDDLLNDRSSGWPKPYFRIRGGRLELHPPAHDLATQLRARSYLIEGVLQVLERNRPPKSRAPDAGEVDPVELFAAIAATLRAEVERDGARLVAALAHPRGDRPSPHRDEVLAVLNEQGIEVVDLFGAVQGAGGEPTELFLPCGHWSPLAHGRVARALAPALR